MGYRLSGTLKLPSGVAAAGVTILFTAQKSFSPLIEQASIPVRTDSAGKYEVTLEFNSYKVDVTFANNIPFTAGSFTVAPDTVAAQDLPSLLSVGGWTPATPEWIIQIQNWLADASASASAAADSASAAATSEGNAKISETNAKTSETAALASKNAAKTSETNSKTSEVASLANKNESADSASAAADSASAAATSEGNAKISETNAKTSETAAAVSADRAEQAAQTVVGALVDAGAYDPSNGVLPEPIVLGGKKRSCIWKVTANGIAGGIELGVGDSLVYTNSDNTYYKIDNTESVSKVNNKTGVVVLSAGDVGAYSKAESDTKFIGALSDVYPPSNDANLAESGYRFYEMVGTKLNTPSGAGSGNLISLARDYSGVMSSGSQIYADGKGLWYRGASSGLFDGWQKVYTDSSKPTPSDIGAEPAGTASSAVSAHEAKESAHSISGVSGLQPALDAKASATSVTAINSRVTALEARKSTCIVNATGTGAPHETVSSQLPVEITTNSRYVLPNPFGDNTPVECWAELFINGKWSKVGWIYDASGGWGADACYVQGEGIVLQTGSYRLAWDSNKSGGGHGWAGGTLTLAKCRIFVRKLES